MTNTSPENLDSPAPDLTPPPVPPPPTEDAATRRWRWAFGLAVVGIGVLLVTQLVMIQTLRDTKTGIDDVDAAIAEVGGDVASLEGEVSDVGERITSLEEQRLALAPGPQSGAPETTDQGTAPPPEPEPTITVVAASLPRFQGNSNSDPALGMVLGDVTGIEYYTEQATTYAPEDGISRAILVWAHWCPYCQQEIPEVAQWIETSAADFPNMEIVSVTTSIDENGANPLFPYLDDNQWPFPVLVDDTGALAAQLGVNAFPFWVFVGPDGSVLGRTAGALPMEQLTGIFTQLDDIGAQA